MRLNPWANISGGCSGFSSSFCLGLYKALCISISSLKIALFSVVRLIIFSWNNLVFSAWIFNTLLLNSIIEFIPWAIEDNPALSINVWRSFWDICTLAIDCCALPLAFAIAASVSDIELDALLTSEPITEATTVSPLVISGIPLIGDSSAEPSPSSPDPSLNIPSIIDDTSSPIILPIIAIREAISSLPEVLSGL